MGRLCSAKVVPHVGIMQLTAGRGSARFGSISADPTAFLYGQDRHFSTSVRRLQDRQMAAAGQTCSIAQWTE
jgi:hypothetical protein